jgi:hypothetical protein
MSFDQIKRPYDPVMLNMNSVNGKSKKKANNRPRCKYADQAFFRIRATCTSKNNGENN